MRKVCEPGYDLPKRVDVAGQTRGGLATSQPFAFAGKKRGKGKGGTKKC